LLKHLNNEKGAQLSLERLDSGGMIEFDRTEADRTSKLVGHVGIPWVSECVYTLLEEPFRGCHDSLSLGWGVGCYRHPNA
jgi:hypothetical protein